MEKNEISNEFNEFNEGEKYTCISCGIENKHYRLGYKNKHGDVFVESIPLSKPYFGLLHPNDEFSLEKGEIHIFCKTREHLQSPIVELSLDFDLAAKEKFFEGNLSYKMMDIRHQIEETDFFLFFCINHKAKENRSELITVKVPKGGNEEKISLLKRALENTKSLLIERQVYLSLDTPMFLSTREIKIDKTIITGLKGVKTSTLALTKVK